MSAIGDAIAPGLAALSTLKGESLGYRTGTTGSFTALSGFCLHQARGEAPMFDETHASEVQKRLATLKGPVTPAMARGYQVKDLITGIIYAVQFVKIDVQQVCALEEREPTKRTPDRHGSA